MNTYTLTAFYQDMILNHGGHRRGYSIDRKCAVNIGTIEVQANSIDDALEIGYMKLNSLDIPKGHPRRPVFEEAGHTSMSVGDFFEVEGQEGVFLVVNVGFSHISGDELVAAEKKGAGPLPAFDWKYRSERSQKLHGMTAEKIEWLEEMAKEDRKDAYLDDRAAQDFVDGITGGK